jgi:hypothetical protein
MRTQTSLSWVKWTKFDVDTVVPFGQSIRSSKELTSGLTEFELADQAYLMPG